MYVTPSRAKPGSSPSHTPQLSRRSTLQANAIQSPRQKALTQLQQMADQVEGPLQRLVDAETGHKKAIQKAEAPAQNPNRTGLPDSLKSGVENLSGVSLDRVKVHYNSSKPAAVQAHAYAQGTNIHLGPGQEKHLPHEAWHVVQQAQGRVKPTTQMNGVAINDDVGLEKEADIMGAKATNQSAQLKADPDLDTRKVPAEVQQQASFITVKRIASGGNLFMGKSTAGPPALGFNGGTNWYGPKVTAAEYGQPPGAVWRMTAAHNLNLLDMSSSESVKRILEETQRRRGIHGLSANLQAALANHDFAYAIPNAVADVADSYLDYGVQSAAHNNPAWPGNNYGVTQGQVDNVVMLAAAANQVPLLVGSVIQTFAGQNSAQAVTLDNPGFMANPNGFRMIRKDATNLDAGFANALLANLNDPALFHGLHVPQGMKFGGWTGTKHEILISNSPGNLNLQGQVAVPGPEADLVVTNKLLGIDNSFLAWAWRLFGGNR